MPSVTQGGRCSLEQQLTNTSAVVPPPPPPSGPLIERSELARDSSSSPSARSIARERPSDGVPTSALAVLSPRTPLDDEWLTAEGDMLQDLFRAWDAEGVDGAHSSSIDTSDSSSNSPEPAPCENLAIEASVKLPRNRTRVSTTLVAKRSRRTFGSNSGKSRPAATSSSTRQKLEIQVLRNNALDLSEKLRRLKEATRIARTRDAPTPISESDDAALCKALAKMQLERLEQAQRENEQLKLTMLEYKEMAKSLRRALMKRAKRHTLLAKTMQLPPLHPTNNLELTSDDRKIFQLLIANTNIMRENMDIVLEHLQTKTPRVHSGSFRSWDVRCDAAMTLFPEVVDCEEVPFRKAHVENVMRVLRDQKKAGSRRYDAQVFGGSPEVVLTKLHFHYSNAIESGVYCGREASRDFEDDDTRSYSVYIAYTEPIDVSGNAAPGFLLKLQTWKILAEQLHTVEGKQHATTRIQSYSTLTPVQTRGLNPVRWEKELIEKFVIPEWGRSISAVHRMLENALLDLQ